MSLEFEAWRLNLRLSNTEPLLRLNVETRSDQSAVLYHVSEIEAVIDQTVKEDGLSQRGQQENNATNA